MTNDELVICSLCASSTNHDIFEVDGRGFAICENCYLLINRVIDKRLKK